MDEALDMLEFANSQGLRMLADIYAYDAWTTASAAKYPDRHHFFVPNREYFFLL